MKKCVCICLLITALLPCHGQYTVTEVEGVVKNKVSGETIKTGSKFKQANDLNFYSSRCMVRAIVTGRGVVVLQPVAKLANPANPVVEVVKYMFSLKATDGNLSGRGVDEQMIPAALETDTQWNKKNLFCAVNKYRYDPINYQVANGDQFFLQLDYPGDSPIVIPLKTIDDTLLIYASNFLTKKHPKILDKARYELGFYSKQKESGEPLIEIKPYLSSNSEMELIIKSMITGSNIKDPGWLLRVCYQEVYQSMGKPAGQLFKSSFDKILAGTTK